MQPPPLNQPKRRRLLALPAVCPCEGIAPEPLLASLVSLAADVASRRASDASAFPVLRRAVRQAARLAGLLLAFLEEVRDATTSALPFSAVLGLTELHVAMQKMRFLLTDCARRGARLWVLVNAGQIASELRLCLGSVAAAMDVLPSSVVDASEEAGELGRLVADQAWRAVLRPDAGDRLTLRSVRSIMDQFKKGVAPESEDVMRVLRRIGVETWSQCSEEVAFLDGELAARSDAGDESSSEVVLINGLMAFLVYCRVVLFDRIDSKQADALRPATCPEWIRPEALQCPITLELMTDPVTVSTGQTYDRASISRWMKAGCRTCPVTGERLRTADLVPNAALSGIIEAMLLSNGVSLPEPSSTRHHHGDVGGSAAPFSAAAAGAARLAVAHIVAQFSTGSTEDRRKATCEARKLSKHSLFYRARFVEANAVPWLLCLLSTMDASVQDNAVASLLSLSKHPGGRAALVEAGGIGIVVDVVNVGAKAETQQNAVAILFYLSSNAEYAEEIGRFPEAIPTLVRLIREGAQRSRKNAMVSLYGLLQSPSNHAKAVAAGAVAALAGLLCSDRDGDLASDTVSVLARIAEQPAGALAVLSSPGLVARLVDFLAASASRSGKDHCVGLLVLLCRHGGEKVVALLGGMRGLMGSLHSLVADGSPTTSKKARSLINVIHRHYEFSRPSSLPAPVPDAGRERIVRVVL